MIHDMLPVSNLLEWGKIRLYVRRNANLGYHSSSGLKHGIMYMIQQHVSWMQMVWDAAIKLQQGF